jgi:hypothetical protein
MHHHHHHHRHFAYHAFITTMHASPSHSLFTMNASPSPSHTYLPCTTIITIHACINIIITTITTGTTECNRATKM